MDERAPTRTPVRLRPRRPCAICGQRSEQKYHPFCSARCADVDLHRWLGGVYAVPSDKAPYIDDPAGSDDEESG